MFHFSGRCLTADNKLFQFELKILITIKKNKNHTNIHTWGSEWVLQHNGCSRVIYDDSHAISEMFVWESLAPKVEPSLQAACIRFFLRNCIIKNGYLYEFAFFCVFISFLLRMSKKINSILSKKIKIMVYKEIMESE
jgi:hypothetical protein